MNRYVVLLIVLCLLGACGGEPTPAPDLEAMQVAVEMAAHATMTAEMPTPTPTAIPTNTPQPTVTLTPTSMPIPSTATPSSTSTPTPTDTPTATFTATSTSTRVPTKLPPPAAAPTSTTPVKQLVFSEGCQGDFFSEGETDAFLPPDIYVMDLETGSRTAISTGGAYCWAVWSPDGELVLYDNVEMSIRWDGQLVFSQYASELSLMNADGSNARQLMSVPNPSAWIGHPIWSPDGTKIAVRYEYQSDYGIFIVNSDGTGWQRLNNSDVSDSPTYWSTDGRWIIGGPPSQRTEFALEVQGDRRVPLSELGQVQVYDQTYYPWKVIEVP